MFQQTAEEEYLIKIIDAVLFNKQLLPPQSDVNFKKLCYVAAKSSLGGFLYEAFSNSEYDIDNNTLGIAFEIRNRSIAKEAAQETEGQKILSQMEEKGICAIPLKGFLIKNLYPKPYMRGSVDVDILCDPAKEMQAEEIIENAQYIKMHHGGCHNIYTKEPSITIELHKKLFHSPNPVLNEFSTRAYETAIPYKDYKYVKQFTNENNYLYMLIHAAYHLKNAGTGFRYALDQFLFLDKYAEALDWEYINDTLKYLNLEKVHAHLLELCPYLFPDIKEKSSFFRDYEYKCSKDTLKMLYSYLFHSSAVGTVTNMAKLNTIQVIRKHNTEKSVFTNLSSIFHRIFLGRRHMENYYPALKQHPVLLPYYWAVRFFKTIIRNKNYVISYIKTIRNADREEIATLKKLYDELGL